MAKTHMKVVDRFQTYCGKSLPVNVDRVSFVRDEASVDCKLCLNALAKEKGVLPAKVRMVSPREQALIEYNIARAVNKKVEQIGWMVQRMLQHELDDDEDTMHPVASAVLAMVVPFRPDEVEALYTRRHALLKKQYYPKWEKLTPEEEVEYEAIQKELMDLPSARDMDDQRVADSIRWLADRLRHPKEEVKEDV